MSSTLHDHAALDSEGGVSAPTQTSLDLDQKKLVLGLAKNEHEQTLFVFTE